LTSLVNRIINDVISEDRESRFLMIGNKKQRRLTFNLLHTQSPELERIKYEQSLITLRLAYTM